jgi:Na+/H+ antiporter NhaD/arsenite permease-like protein
MSEIVVLIFVLGYAAIAFENTIKINKSAIALITGVLCWVVYMFFSSDKVVVSGELSTHLGELSAILFFLMGAMTIVELIDTHDGFDIITTQINQKDKRKLMWVIGFITFFLSSILDNLTTTIVIVSLLRKLIRNDKDRLFFAGIVVIAANAGGAWTPIGDVTTTMLWMGGQITTVNIMLKLIIPSLFCLLIPLSFLSFSIKGVVENSVRKADTNHGLSQRQKSIVFYSGILVLVLVPVFKTLTHLPPYMGMLFGLGILWIITEVIHRRKDVDTKHALSVSQALRKIDMSTILFFLGILICIAALQSTGVLLTAANWLTTHVKNISIVTMSIGLLSSVVDNVPLVAAAQGMYSLNVYPPDHFFWEFLAFAAGTGGSILIIGSAAGVAAMGMEKIDFFWYMRKISLIALLGYLAGCFAYILQNYLLHL